MGVGCRPSPRARFAAFGCFGRPGLLRPRWTALGAADGAAKATSTSVLLRSLACGGGCPTQPPQDSNCVLGRSTLPCRYLSPVLCPLSQISQYDPGEDHGAADQQLDAGLLRAVPINVGSSSLTFLRHGCYSLRYDSHRITSEVGMKLSISMKVVLSACLIVGGGDGVFFNGGRL